MQDRVLVSVLGNAQQAANARVDRTGLAPGKGAPLQSMGFSSIGLGRDRFQRYAAERLASAGVERMLRGHHTDRTFDTETPEAARESAAAAHFAAFASMCGLRELGPKDNQILDAIRGGDHRSARRGDLEAVMGDVRRRIFEGNAVQDSGALKVRIANMLQERYGGFVRDQQRKDSERAAAWVGAVQQRICEAASVLLGRAGAPVAVRVVELLIDELATAVVPELRQAVDVLRRTAGTSGHRVHGAFAGLEGKISTDHPAIEQGIRDGATGLWAGAEAQLHELTATLVGDLVEHVLRPLRTALDQARVTVQAAAEGSPEQPSTVESWARREVPYRFEPAANEVLLEPVGSYPEQFDRLLVATTGRPDVGGAESQAIEEIVSGAGIDGQDTAVQLRTSWVPQQESLAVSSAAPREARFSLDVKPERLLTRARAWAGRSDTAMGRYVKESLNDYLAEDGVDAQVHRDRLERYRRGLTQALATSQPFARVDPAALTAWTDSSSVSFTRVMTTIPFAKGHPACDVSRQVLLADGMEEQAIEKLFGDGSDSKIEMTTFLAAPYQPVVFSSLMRPIADEWTKRKSEGTIGAFWQWRRARPLPQFVPVSPQVRVAMVRGWFTARLLGQVRADDARHEPTTLWLPQHGWASFPWPLLAQPTRDGRELLPVLLESLPLALAEALNDPAPLRPYQRLIALGQPDYDGDRTELHPVLDSWVRLGKLEDGAPQPPAAAAGTADGAMASRLDAIEARLDEVLGSYEQLDGLVATIDTMSSLGRAWELRADLMVGLRSLRDMCKRARDVAPESW